MGLLNGEKTNIYDTRKIKFLWEQRYKRGSTWNRIATTVENKEKTCFFFFAFFAFFLVFVGLVFLYILKLE